MDASTRQPLSGIQRVAQIKGWRLPFVGKTLRMAPIFLSQSAKETLLSISFVVRNVYTRKQGHTHYRSCGLRPKGPRTKYAILNGLDLKNYHRALACIARIGRKFRVISPVRFMCGELALSHLRHKAEFRQIPAPAIQQTLYDQVHRVYRVCSLDLGCSWFI